MKKVDNNTPTNTIAFSVSPQEFQTIYKEFSASTYTYLGRYVKSIVTKGPLTMYYRNKSVDELLAGMNEIINILLDIKAMHETALENIQTRTSTTEWVLMKTQTVHTIETLKITIEEIRLQMIKIYNYARRCQMGGEPENAGRLS